MTYINSQTPIDPTKFVSGVNPTGDTKGVSGTDTIPSFGDMTLGELVDSLDLPDIPLSMRGISIEELLTAVADEDRRNNIKSSVNSIEQKGEEQKVENDKKLNEIKTQLEKMRKQTFWQKLMKVFQIIGAIFGAIASAATIAVGAVTGNVALVAAGILGAITTIDSIVSLATDGEVSIAAGYTKLGKALGMSDEAAQWFGFGMNMAILVVGVAATFGASAASSSANLSQNASKALDMLAKISTYSNVGSGLLGVGKGVASGVLAYYNYDIAKSKARNVDIDAILESIRNAIKNEEDFIENQINVANELMEDVKEIVEGCGETATTILTGNPAPA